MIVLNKMLAVFVTRKKVMLKELQSLVGHLNFACKVVAPALLRGLWGTWLGFCRT